MKWEDIQLKDIYAGFALLVATVLSFVGTFLPPQGIVDSSMLYLIAQFLLLAATLLGFGNVYRKITNRLDKLETKRYEENKD